MILYKTILILEDNLYVLSKLLEGLYSLEHDQPFDLTVIILTTSAQVEDYINSNAKATFDIVLIDRDCKLNKSFHILNLEKFGANKAIAISSIKEYNQELEKRGVQHTITKNLDEIDTFVEKVINQVKLMLSNKRNQFTM